MYRLYSLLLLLILAACRPSATLPGELPPDFVRFYERFHTDSAFQMAHVQFPLKGLPDYAHEAAIDPDRFYWHEEDWVVHRPMEASASDFRKEFTLLSDNMIVERTLHVQKPLFTERRFVKLDKDWKLVYYAGINAYRLADEAQ
jgi:hypothetical protein